MTCRQHYDLNCLQTASVSRGTSLLPVTLPAHPANVLRVNSVPHRPVLGVFPSGFRAPRPVKIRTKIRTCVRISWYIVFSKQDRAKGASEAPNGTKRRRRGYAHRSLSKPSATLVLGGGHSIGIPLAVAARHSFIVPTATMTVHPVRHSVMVLGVPQTLRYFEQMQERIVSFVTGHSKITARRFTQLMHNTGELVMDMGTVLDGTQAVEEGLIDELGGLADALGYLYKEIEK